MREPLRIWGLGSDHGDDRIGWAVVESLAIDPQCGPCSRRARAPWDLLLDDPWPSRMIVVDAGQWGEAAGAIVEVSLAAGNGHVACEDDPTLDRMRTIVSELSSGSRGSSHGASLPEVLQLARRLGRSVEQLVLLAVQVEQCDPGTDLSDPARRAVPRVVDRVRQLACDWLRQDTCGNAS